MQFVTSRWFWWTLCMWVTYCALPEPARKPLMVPANSTILPLE
jgi:hypothetical protein